MKLNIIPARAASSWIRLGLQTFMRQPLTFLSLFFFFMAIASLASLLPVVGGFLALMLLPTMNLALMAATAQQACASTVAPPMGSVLLTALHAVRTNMRALTILGALYAVCFLTVIGISAIADGGQFARTYLLGQPLTQEVAQATDFQIALWITMLLYLPLLLAFWHAPALVHWYRVPPVKSIFFSLVACIRNIKALLLFGVLWFGLLIGLSVTLSLLIALMALVGISALSSMMLVSGALIMAAIFVCSMWFTFRDSFDPN